MYDTQARLLPKSLHVSCALLCCTALGSLSVALPFVIVQQKLFSVSFCSDTKYGYGPGGRQVSGFDEVTKFCRSLAWLLHT